MSQYTIPIYVELCGPRGGRLCYEDEIDYLDNPDVQIFEGSEVELRETAIMYQIDVDNNPGRPRRYQARAARTILDWLASEVRP